MIIDENLFGLRDESIETSKLVYGGKIIKCLVAPYHTFGELEKVVPWTNQTFLFPEREMSTHKTRSFISMLVNNPKYTDVKIITSSYNIIQDMVGDCVRVLSERGTIENMFSKTFAANIYDIKLDLLENELNEVTTADRAQSIKVVQEYVDIINDGKITTQAELDDMRKKVNMIGEVLIRIQLNKKLDEILF
jgi:hypothetical protein